MNLINLKLILLNQLKWILGKLFGILCRQYHSMWFYLRAGFSLPTQASFFLICVGNSAGTGYYLCPMPRPGLTYKLEALGISVELLNFFQSFLSSRFQRVFLNGHPQLDHQSWQGFHKAQYLELCSFSIHDSSNR